ncbi:hypothetical protein IKS57_04010, partial [bacterium]|nr:hypothetical protein [bacterium]
IFDFRIKYKNLSLNQLATKINNEINNNYVSKSTIAYFFHK